MGIEAPRRRPEAAAAAAAAASVYLGFFPSSPPTRVTGSLMEKVEMGSSLNRLET